MLNLLLRTFVHIFLMHFQRRRQLIQVPITNPDQRSIFVGAVKAAIHRHVHRQRGAAAYTLHRSSDVATRAAAKWPRPPARKACLSKIATTVRTRTARERVAVHIGRNTEKLAYSLALALCVVKFYLQPRNNRIHSYIFQLSHEGVI